MTKKFNVATAMAELESANILISYSGFMSDQTLEGVSQGIKSIFETGSLKTRKSRKNKRKSTKRYRIGTPWGRPRGALGPAAGGTQGAPILSLLVDFLLFLS